MSNDVQVLLIDAFTPAVPGVVVDIRRGDPDGPAFIVVRRIGGAALSRVHEDATVVVESYDRLASKALERLEACRDVMWSRSSVARPRGFRGVSELAGPGYDPDPDTPRLERYSMTAVIRKRRT